MDFKITTSQGIGQLEFVKNTDISTNIWLSLNVDYGKFWANPTFGNKIYMVRKVTDSNVLLAKQYVEEALNWLLQIGRATSIVVLAEKDTDPRNQGRINIKVEARQPDGLIVTYNQWYRVI